FLLRKRLREITALIFLSRLCFAVRTITACQFCAPVAIRNMAVPTGTAGTTSSLAVLVVSTPPKAGLVAPLRGAVEPWVHAPETVEPSRIGGIGVVDDAVFERECAHARPLANVRRRVRSAHSRER